MAADRGLQASDRDELSRIVFVSFIFWHHWCATLALLHATFVLLCHMSHNSAESIQIRDRISLPIWILGHGSVLAGL
eukprot:scaffold15294_cov75-Skeletonema_dohrnii-CCMP3373.AAC.1